MISVGYPYIMQSAMRSAVIANNDEIFTPDERAFRNTTPYYLRINALGIGSIAYSDNLEVDDTLVDSIPSWSRLEWAVRIGHTEVTNGWVPLAATTWAPHGDEYAGGMVVFDKPVYLAPNDRLDMKFRAREGMTVAQMPSLFARCTPVVRPDPTMYVPAIYGWESAAIDPPITAIDQSVPIGKFYNEYDAPMLVERLIGKTAHYTWKQRRRYAVANVLVDLALQDATKITRAPVPLASLFDLARQSWTMNMMLPPKGYVEAKLSGAISIAGDPFYVYLGMLGYRAIG